MKKIEVPSMDVIMEINNDEWEESLEGFIDGFKKGIVYANEQIEKNHISSIGLTGEETANLLNNLRKQLELTPEGPNVDFWKGIIDKIADSFVEKPWQPKPGQKCAFFDKDSDAGAVGVLKSYHPDSTTIWSVQASNGDWFEHCAALESLDEIGKPPSYFQNRGRCTVTKEQKGE